MAETSCGSVSSAVFHVPTSPAVAQHGDPVGDLEDFLEMMGDVEDGQSPSAEGSEDPE